MRRPLPFHAVVRPTVGLVCRSAGALYVDGAEALIGFLGVVLDRFTFFETFSVTQSFHIAFVDEYVFRSVFWSDEAVPFFRAEPFNLSLCHSVGTSAYCEALNKRGTVPEATHPWGRNVRVECCYE